MEKVPAGWFELGGSAAAENIHLTRKENRHKAGAYYVRPPRNRRFENIISTDSQTRYNLRLPFPDDSPFPDRDAMMLFSASHRAVKFNVRSRSDFDLILAGRPWKFQKNKF